MNPVVMITNPYEFLVIPGNPFVDSLVKKRTAGLEGGSPYSNEVLDNTKKIIWDYMMPKYRKYLGWGKLMEIINKIISNSHVGGDPIGSGIYVFSSLTNHDCNNNCTFWTEKSKLNLAAFKKIHKGEEISISYINETYKPK